ncbi:hypothetical protein [Polaromonas sp. CG9_12]|nr:hypothetical protein [Polaromonas sp. CG9_12]
MNRHTTACGEFPAGDAVTGFQWRACFCGKLGSFQPLALMHIAQAASNSIADD